MGELHAKADLPSVEVVVGPEAIVDGDGSARKRRRGRRQLRCLGDDQVLVQMQVAEAGQDRDRNMLMFKDGTLQVGFSALQEAIAADGNRAAGQAGKSDQGTIFSTIGGVEKRSRQYWTALRELVGADGARTEKEIGGRKRAIAGRTERRLEGKPAAVSILVIDCVAVEDASEWLAQGAGTRIARWPSREQRGNPVVFRPGEPIVGAETPLPACGPFAVHRGFVANWMLSRRCDFFV